MNCPEQNTTHPLSTLLDMVGAWGSKFRLRLEIYFWSPIKFWEILVVFSCFLWINNPFIVGYSQWLYLDKTWYTGRANSPVHGSSRWWDSWTLWSFCVQDPKTHSNRTNIWSYRSKLGVKSKWKAMESADFFKRFDTVNILPILGKWIYPRVIKLFTDCYVEQFNNVSSYPGNGLYCEFGWTENFRTESFSFSPAKNCSYVLGDKYTTEPYLLDWAVNFCKSNMGEKAFFKNK